MPELTVIMTMIPINKVHVTDNSAKAKDFTVQ